MLSEYLPEFVAGKLPWLGGALVSLWVAAKGREAGWLKLPAVLGGAKAADAHQFKSDEKPPAVVGDWVKRVVGQFPKADDKTLLRWIVEDKTLYEMAMDYATASASGEAKP